MNKTLALAAAEIHVIKMPNKLTATILPLAFANSPSGCAIFCIAVGEMPQGKENLEFNTVQLGSRTDTSRKNLGRIRNLNQTKKQHEKCLEFN